MTGGLKPKRLIPFYVQTSGGSESRTCIAPNWIACREQCGHRELLSKQNVRSGCLSHAVNSFVSNRGMSRLSSSASRPSKSTRVQGVGIDHSYFGRPNKLAKLAEVSVVCCKAGGPTGLIRRCR